MQRIKRWLEINPRDPRAWYLGALGLGALGRYDEGRDWLERARALAPDDPVVQYVAVCSYSFSAQVCKSPSKGRCGSGRGSAVHSALSRFRSGPP